MSYQYDVFFSYKRDRESDAWHERVKNILEFWLKQELQRQNVRIFFDTEEIRTGMRWRQKLTDALKQSRCIACVWSPLYFQSKWCVSEWHVEAEAAPHQLGPAPVTRPRRGTRRRVGMVAIASCPRRKRPRRGPHHTTNIGANVASKNGNKSRSTDNAASRSTAIARGRDFA